MEVINAEIRQDTWEDPRAGFEAPEDTLGQTEIVEENKTIRVKSIHESRDIALDKALTYTLQNIAYELKRRKKELPIFKEPVPIVVSGGLTLATGFEERVQQIINTIDFPLKVGKVIRAAEPMKAVAQGCYLASQM